MATTIVPGHRTWSMTRDGEGHREYTLTWLIEAAPTDGPANVLQTAGLPQPGDFWHIDDDIDFQAVCRPEITITPLIDNEPNKHWHVVQKYSTRGWDKCYLIDLGTGTALLDNPLFEPAKVTGGFTRFTQEASEDKDGNPILNSAHELIRGPQNEWDAGRPFIQFEQNIEAADFDIEVLFGMQDTVNSVSMWGLDPRVVKLSDISFEEMYFRDCTIYYKRVLYFEIAFETWDRYVLDEGTKVLNGHWDKNTDEWVVRNIGLFGLGVVPDSSNPAHFIRATDRYGSPMRVVLNSAGVPATSEADAGRIFIQKYAEANHLSLGLPTGWDS